MKELSIEEKAKCYDEAIERAKTKLINKVAEDIFPELKESEDERIRKALIDIIKSQKEQQCHIDSAVFDETLAWLEKQREQKSAETVKWSPQEESCICQLESLVKEQWRQADKVHNSVNIKRMSELMFFLKTLNPNKKPQRIISAEAKEAMYDKPAWSEEDESILQGIWDEISANKHDAKEYEWKTYDRFLDWLKSLKERVQPKVELTMLDKNILEAAIAFVKQKQPF